MESLRLLKHWRGGVGCGAPAAPPPVSATIATTVLRPSSETEDDDGDCDDEGPFFDLEFPLPDEEKGSYGPDSEEDEKDFDFALSSDGSFGGVGGRLDAANLSLSPSDDLFFKGRLHPLESSSLLFSTTSSSVPHSKPTQFSANLLKPATKFRVFMLRFKKPKSTPVELANGAAATASPKQNQQHKQSKLFVKFKVEEVPLVSLFTRDNSSRSSSSSGRTAAKPQAHDDGATPSTEEKKFSREVLQRYLSKIKPLYVRVSKRYTDKLKFSGQLDPRGPPAKPAPGSPASSKITDPEATIGGGKSFPAGGLRVVRRRLRKSRSASSTVVAVRSPPRRRDDSLLQQQDGIQSAIAHCKRSFNSEKESESPLARSNSESAIARSEKTNVA